MDKGEIKVLDHILKAGQVIFHKPNEFHNLAATGVSAPSGLGVSFACTSPAMKFFEGRILEVSEYERGLLGPVSYTHLPWWFPMNFSWVISV